MNNLFHRVVVVCCTLLIIDGFSSFAISQAGCGSVIRDIDGNTYKTVQIGTQCWMAENLRTSKYRDGTPIPNVQDGSRWSSLTTGAWSYYENSASNNALYGKLYNWYAASNSRQICPVNWHLPSEMEWTVLSNYLGSEPGPKLKSTTGWNNDGNGLNSSGFNGMPGGGRTPEGRFSLYGRLGSFWSSRESGRDYAYYRYLSYDYTRNLDINNTKKSVGFSVRCIRD